MPYQFYKEDAKTNLWMVVKDSNLKILKFLYESINCNNFDLLNSNKRRGLQYESRIIL